MNNVTTTISGTGGEEEIAKPKFIRIPVIAKLQTLLDNGYTIGLRNPTIQADIAGNYMVMNGSITTYSYCIVGSNLEELVHEAFAYYEIIW